MRPVFLGRVVVTLVLLTCLRCNSQTRVPEGPLSRIAVQALGAGVERFSNMVVVADASHSFQIDPFEVSELATGDFFSIRNQIPKTGITPVEAGSICASLGKRLCTASEWTNACLGTHRRTFSYNAQAQPGKCNTGSALLQRTGMRKDCRSDEGVYDMVGNTMEWLGDLRGTMAIAAGGSMNTGDSANCFTNLYFPADARSEQIGFRCCKSEVKR
ncbi:MAG: SUMF1/EgtB/PvdO family nonheme iron enzyme [Spirochaetia bacterium]|nr:SUMF1/EgtB/PvdO family nonheme iron enzyme [Spirochaetia bacterium]